jgi:protein SCO1
MASTSDRPMRVRWCTRIWILAVASVLIAAGCAADGDDAAELEGITRPEPLQVGSLTVPEVSTDGTEADFAFRGPPGGLLYVYFGYTNCPDLCPTTLADLRAALAQVGPDAARVDAAFVTVDPDRDTPEVITGYLSSFVEDGHAVRITDPDLLREVEDAFGASSTIRTGEDGTIEVAHTSISYLVDADGAVVVEWPFGVSPDAMAHDLRILLDRPPEERT